MGVDSQKKISLPKADGSLVELSVEQSVLLIGANGAGKTRLGTWIDLQSPYNKIVHRISAQKSIAMPDTTTPVALDRAEKDLLFGNADAATGKEHGFKSGHKWHGKPATLFLNDFQKLMVYLFSDETEENAKYKVSQRAAPHKIDPPLTKLDLVKQLWEKTLPHRELIVGGLRIQTQLKDSINKQYSASEMSDGERVIFYLIGQCLAAPQNGVIVIDEPELHLHKSIQTSLWNDIEALRKDCVFIYLTHDVDFAAAKTDSTKIWLKSYDGTVWDWEVIQEDESLPQDLLLEILGSRKPVVFVEGEINSYDSALYRAILPTFLVIPRGSCSQVIQSVKALKANTQLHNLNVCGIIDRDRRLPAEIQKLEQDSIFVLSVAEVENLFCVKEVLQLVSKLLVRKPDEDFSAVSDYIFTRLNNELETQVSLRVASEIKFQLRMFDESQKGVTALESALQRLVNDINVKDLYAQTLANFNNVIGSRDYEALLSLYNRKNLPDQVSTVFGLKKGELPELVIRLVNDSSSRNEIVAGLKKYFGNFGDKIV